jgi:hypothetical protein
MGFTQFPPTSSTKIQDWTWWLQIYKALDEVAAAGGAIIQRGSNTFPPTTNIWDGNEIGEGVELTSTSLTDDSSHVEGDDPPVTVYDKNWYVYLPGHYDGPRYVSWPSPLAPPVFPTDYSLVLMKLYDGGQWDWRKMLIVPITGQVTSGSGTGGTSRTLTFAEIDIINYPLEYFTHYFIINAEGSWMSNRVPEWPNDFTWDWASARGASPTALAIEKTTKPHWNDSGKLTTGPRHTQDWVGLWLYYVNDDGNARSAQITGMIESGGATGTVDLDTGTVASITVTDGGDGYTTAPTVTISGDGTDATATAVLVDMKVDSVTITNPGSGYTSATVTFTGGDDNWVIQFASQDPVPTTGIFGVLPDDDKYWRREHQNYTNPNGVDVAPYKAWYRGGDAQTGDGYSHFPDDTLRDTTFPDHAFVFPGSDPDFGEGPLDLINAIDSRGLGTPTPTPTDLDAISQPAEDHIGVDRCFSVPLWMTPRSWQSALWNACNLFVPYRADKYDGYDRFNINDMVVPRFMWEAQVNAAHGLTGYLIYDEDTIVGIGVSGLAFSNTPAFTPIDVVCTAEKLTRWTALGGGSYTHAPEKIDRGERLDTFTAVWNGTYLETTGVDETFQLQDLWFTWGWTRKVPDQVRHIYRRTAVAPELNDDDEIVGPSEDHPWDWDTWDRLPDAGLVDYTDYGRVIISIAPTTGNLVRYIGDNFNDPTNLYASDHPFAVYYDQLYEGKSVAERGERNFDTWSGSVLADNAANLTSYQFQSLGESFWPAVLIGDEGSSTHSGDVTVGNFSSTTITDTSHAGSNFWDGTRGRWVGHWLVIWQPGAIDTGGTAGPLHLVRRAITSYSAGSQVLGFGAITGLSNEYAYLTDAEDEDSDETGQTRYFIEEPGTPDAGGIKNFFVGSFIDITRSSDGEVLTGTITYNSNDCIHFASLKDSDDNSVTYTPVTGDAWTIRRWSTGVTLRWSGSAYVRPTGGGFPELLTKVPPTRHIRYGRAMKNDYLDADFFREVYQGRNALRMTKEALNFEGEDSFKDYIVHGAGSGTYAEAQAALADAWDDLTPVDGSNPTAYYIGMARNTTAAGDQGAHAGRGGSYGHVQLPAGITEVFSTAYQRLRLAATVYFLSYAEIDSFLHDEGPDKTWHTIGGRDVYDEFGYVGSFSYPSSQAIEDGTGSPGSQLGDVRVYSFDGNGDAVTFRKWKIFESDGPSTAIDRLSGSALGDITASLPNAPSAPVDASTHTDGVFIPAGGDPEPGVGYVSSPEVSYINGYYVRDGVAIVDYGDAMEFIGAAGATHHMWTYPNSGSSRSVATLTADGELATSSTSSGSTSSATLVDFPDTLPETLNWTTDVVRSEDDVTFVTAPITLDRVDPPSSSFEGRTCIAEWLGVEDVNVRVVLITGDGPDYFEARWYLTTLCTWRLTSSGSPAGSYAIHDNTTSPPLYTDPMVITL